MFHFYFKADMFLSPFSIYYTFLNSVYCCKYSYLLCCLGWWQ